MTNPVRICLADDALVVIMPYRLLKQDGYGVRSAVSPDGLSLTEVLGLYRRTLTE